MTRLTSLAAAMLGIVLAVPQETAAQEAPKKVTFYLQDGDTTNDDFKGKTKKGTPIVEVTSERRDTPSEISLVGVKKKMGDPPPEGQMVTTVTLKVNFTKSKAGSNIGPSFTTSLDKGSRLTNITPKGSFEAQLTLNGKLNPNAKLTLYHIYEATVESK